MGYHTICKCIQRNTFKCGEMDMYLSRPNFKRRKTSIKRKLYKIPRCICYILRMRCLLKLQVALESKRYSKSWWDYVGRGVGRCKVNLLNDNGERNIKDPTSDIIFDSRKTLFKRIATLLNDPETKIPKNFRPKEQEAEKIAIAEEEK